MRSSSRISRLAVCPASAASSTSPSGNHPGPPKMRSTAGALGSPRTVLARVFAGVGGVPVPAFPSRIFRPARGDALYLHGDGNQGSAAPRPRSGAHGEDAEITVVVDRVGGGDAVRLADCGRQPATGRPRELPVTMPPADIPHSLKGVPVYGEGPKRPSEDIHPVNTEPAGRRGFREMGPAIVRVAEFFGGQRGQQAGAGVGRVGGMVVKRPSLRALVPPSAGQSLGEQPLGV